MSKLINSLKALGGFYPNKLDEADSELVTNGSRFIPGAKYQYDQLLPLINMGIEAIEVLEKLQEINITDGCEECSSIWTHAYEVKMAKELIAKANKLLEKNRDE